MIERIITWDKDLLLFLNSFNSPFFDTLMYYASDKFIWIPFYIFLIILIAREYRKETFFILAGAGILIALSDLSSVHLFKNIFERLRPCNEPELAGKLHLVNGECGGAFGFVSSHAANMFALALFTIRILGKAIRFYTPLILLWAAFISYSRIYLGVHYPGDVLCGALLGAVIGLGVGKLYWIFRKKYLLHKFSCNTFDT